MEYGAIINKKITGKGFSFTIVCKSESDERKIWEDYAAFDRYLATGNK